MLKVWLNTPKATGLTKIRNARSSSEQAAQTVSDPPLRGAGGVGLSGVGVDRCEVGLFFFRNLLISCRARPN